MLYCKAVKIDEILTDTSKFKVETIISYSNINKKESLVAPIAYQTSNGDFVFIPIYIAGLDSSLNWEPPSAGGEFYTSSGFNLKHL